MQERTKNQELVKLIEEIKFRSKLNQKEIAESIGITQQYLSDLINGRFSLNSELKNKIYENYTYLKDSTSTVSQTSHGDYSPNINGNGNRVDDSSALMKALDEISELRKQNAEQFNRFMGVIENLTK